MKNDPTWYRVNDPEVKDTPRTQLNPYYTVNGFTYVDKLKDREEYDKRRMAELIKEREIYLECKAARAQKKERLVYPTYDYLLWNY